MRQSELALLLVLPLLTGAAPTRTQSYVAGQVIDPDDVTENENNIYSYLAAGVDTIRASAVDSNALASSAVTAAKIATGAVTSTGILDGTIAAADLATQTNGKLFIGNGSGMTAATLTAGTNITITNGAGSITVTGPTLPVAERVIRTAGNVATSSATLVDFTGASITLTTAANPVLVGFAGTCQTDASTTQVYLNVDIGGSVALGAEGIVVSNHTANENLNCSFVAMTADQTAGSHTFKLQWATDGNALMACNTDRACIFWVAEVTD